MGWSREVGGLERVVDKELVKSGESLGKDTEALLTGLMDEL